MGQGGIEGDGKWKGLMATSSFMARSRKDVVVINPFWTRFRHAIVTVSRIRLNAISSNLVIEDCMRSRIEAMRFQAWMMRSLNALTFSVNSCFSFL